jgi:hypothetical protein
MQSLCQKWWGDHEQMHRFARDIATSSAGGSMLHALVPLAHLEITLDLDPNQTTGYMTRPDVRADLRTAAELSIWHPAADVRPGWQFPFNIFAGAFCLSADPAAASAIFQRLGDRPTDVPWGYLPGDPIENFLDARARVAPVG